MTTLAITLELPETLARQAEALGVLTPRALAALVREEVHRRSSRPSVGSDAVFEVDLPRPTRAEIEATLRHLRTHTHHGSGMPVAEVVMEEEPHAATVAARRARRERAMRNADWLQAHWPDVLPRAAGKFLAVAGQEAFLAETARGAQALAEAAHPEDDGVLVQFVRPRSRGEGP